MSRTFSKIGQLFILFVGTVTMFFVGYLAFVAVPNGQLAMPEGGIGTVNVVLIFFSGFVGLLISRSIATSMFSPYNVAEVAVKGPITRDGGGGLPAQPGSTPADDIVEQIEIADESSDIEALIVRLNTPGGEVVPSDDIRLAVEEFDGPTVGYAKDTCASGGYWIGSACDEIFARDTSIVGSIGVIASRINAKEMADKVGLSYEQLTAGEYKDAGVPLKEMEDDEREFLQGIVDGYYEAFVERVIEGRENLTEEDVRETEARYYLGRDAHEMGLVDSIGTHDDVEERIEELAGLDEAYVKEFEPRMKFTRKIRGSAESMAYHFGAGVATVFRNEGDDDFDFKLR